MHGLYICDESVTTYLDANPILPSLALVVSRYACRCVHANLNRSRHFQHRLVGQKHTSCSDAFRLHGCALLPEKQSCSTTSAAVPAAKETSTGAAASSTATAAATSAGGVASVSVLPSLLQLPPNEEIQQEQLVASAADAIKAMSANELRDAALALGLDVTARVQSSRSTILPPRGTLVAPSQRTPPRQCSCRCWTRHRRRRCRLLLRAPPPRRPRALATRRRQGLRMLRMAAALWQRERGGARM